MTYYLFKIALTSTLVVTISELAKRSTLIGGLLASLPIVSYLAMIWLFVETGDHNKVAELSKSIFWLVLPSLPFFMLLPMLLAKTSNFYVSFTVATAVMVAIYLSMLAVLRKLGIEL